MVAELFLALRYAVIDGIEARVALGDGLEVGQCVAPFPEVHGQQGMVVARMEVVGVVLHYDGEVGVSLAEVAQLVGEQCAVIAGGKVVRLVLQHYVVVVDGAVVVVEVVAHEGAVDVEVNLFGVEAYCLVEVFGGFVPVLAVEVDFGADEIVVNVVLVNFDATVNVLESAHGVAGCHSHARAGHHHVVEVGIAFQKVREDGIGLSEALGTHQGDGLVIEEILVVGLVFQSGIEIK